MELIDRKVVLTGASSGIGFELLKELLNEGCEVLACARHIENIQIKSDKLHLRKCDVSKKEELDELFKYAINTMGDIDLFISNAGFAYYEKIDKADYEHIEKIFATNVYAPIYCAEKMKEIKDNKSFNVVITSSAMAELSLPGYALYSGTKAGIKGFADGYRYELENNQHLQVIYPVATRTNFFKAANDNTPVPWPSQTSKTVAQKIVNGIKKDKNHIYPSLTFRVTSIINRVFPFILKAYAKVNDIAFKNWLKNKEGKKDSYE